MDLFTIFFIALGLSMDAIAVAIGLGLSIDTLKIKHGLLIGLFFGIFQALMPIVGWILGTNLKNLIINFDHWIVFGLLLFIGSKMIYESLKSNPSKDALRSLNLFQLFLLSIATSVDALVIGISFALVDIEILMPVIIIGFVTFILSFLGVGFGRYVGYILPRKIETMGGLILIAIGFKILFEHSMM